MNVNFEKQTVGTPVPGVTIDCKTTAAPAQEAPPPSNPAPSSAVATRNDSPHAIFDDGNIGFEDIKLPRINIVQKVGPLSEVFTAGDIVLDQTHVLYSMAKPTPPGQVAAPAPTPLNIVVVGFKRTVFVENVPGGAMGLTCRTREEVVRVGGTLDYKEWDESVKANKADPSVKALRRFDNMATALLLIEKPAKFEDPNHTIFPYECNGKYFVLAFYSMKASAYNNGAKEIFTFKKTRLISNPKASYADNYYTLGTTLGKWRTGNSAPIPDISAAGPVEEAVAHLVESIKGV